MFPLGLRELDVDIGVALSRTTTISQTYAANSQNAGSSESEVQFGDASKPGSMILILGLVAVTQLMVVAVRVLTM